MSDNHTTAPAYQLADLLDDLANELRSLWLARVHRTGLMDLGPTDDFGPNMWQLTQDIEAYEAALNHASSTQNTLWHAARMVASWVEGDRTDASNLQRNCRQGLKEMSDNVLPWLADLNANKGNHRGETKKAIHRLEELATEIRDWPAHQPHTDSANEVLHALRMELDRRGQSNPRWVTFATAERITDINRGTIKRAADKDEIVDNGEEGRDRRIELAAFWQWAEQRASGTAESTESDAEVERKFPHLEA